MSSTRQRKNSRRRGDGDSTGRQAYKTILAIDGGGIRGIIPALVLADIEARIGAPIGTRVDLIAGTSTGGIIGLGLATRDTRAGAKRPYTAAELTELYESHGKEIFHRSLWKGVSSAGSYIDERYDHHPIERILKEYFGDSPIRSTITHTMVTTYDIEAREPFFFKSWRADRSAVPMRLVARATSAAPTYFEPTRVKVGNKMRSLIDGGVFANNPAMCAYSELKRDHPNSRVRVISLGTGELIRPISYDEAKCWGKLNWALPILGCIFDGVSDTVTYQLQQLLGDDFVRMQTRLEFGNDDMDDATNGNIENLKLDARRLIAAHEAELAKICAWLS